MKNPPLPLIAFFFLTLAVPATAQEAGSSAPDSPAAPDAKTTAPASPTVLTLKNGATLVVSREPESPSVAFYVFFRVGRTDEKGNAGVNAVLARVWGEASEYRSSALLQRDIGLSGSVGTQYADDWTAIWTVCGTTDAELEQAATILLVNVIGKPYFAPEVVEKAKREQETALTLEQDSLIGSTLRELQARAYGASPYSVPASGASGRLFLIKPETLAAHYARYFRPERCVVSVAGNIDPERARRLVESAFGASDFNNGPPPPQTTLSTSERVPSGLKDALLPRRAPATVFAAGWLAPGMTQLSAREYAALLLLDAVLGQGKGSRLFTALRDSSTPAGYDVRTVLQTRRGQSLWGTYVIGDVPAATVKAALLAEINDIAGGKRPITPAELVRARALLTTKQVRERQRVRERAFGLGLAEVVGLGATFDFTFAAHLNDVTPDDVNALASRILRENPVIVSTLSTMKQ